MSLEGEEERPEGPQPLFNAPWPAVTIAVAIVGSYAIQAWSGGSEAWVDRFAFAPADLDHWRLWTAATLVLVHGGWPHAIMNALGGLAFGAPVARLLGGGPKGVSGFFGFYLACAVVSSLGFAVLHLHDLSPVVGASGAVSGLMGAASRLFGRGDELAPIRSRGVITLGASWLAINALMAVFGATPILFGARIAWEAHIAGFVAGVLLIGPVARFTRSR